MPPDAVFAVLALAVFGASILQSATGIGYGVIAGPIFLAVLNGREAFQISTAHNFLIGLVLVPWVLKDLDRTVLKYLIAGSAIGVPTGFLIQGVVGIAFLKVFSAAVVGLIAAMLAVDIWRARNGRTPTPADGPEMLLVGSLAGVMGGILAMPGPVASTWMSLRGRRKDAIRATVLAFFIFAYGTGLLLNAAFADVSASTVRLSLVLAPVLVAGIVVGNRVTRRMTEGHFRAVLLLVLVVTAISVALSV